MNLHYRAVGEGKPLIILHGLFGSLDNWLTIAKVLGETNEVYLVDQRNHGKSPHHEVFSYGEMASDLLPLIEQNHLAPVTLLGHSMGGKTAMKFAQRYQERVDKLIIVDIGPRLYPQHHQKILEGLFSIDLEGLRSRQEADAQLAQYVPEMGIRQFLLKNLTRNSEGGFAWKINLPAINEQIENVGEPLASEPKIERPTLFIRGSNSDYIRDVDLPGIEQLFPNSKLETVKGAGHWVHAEQPNLFLEIVKSFTA